MSEISLEIVQSATTQSEVHSLIRMGASLSMLIEHSPYFLVKKQEFLDLVAQAAPLYKELHSSVPSCASLPPDDPFWSGYISLRIPEARALVAQHRNSTAPTTAPGSET